MMYYDEGVIAYWTCVFWSAVSDEGRAMYNGGQAGLTFWSPNVNIFRDPRWGRGQETPGEDPAVSGRYAAAYVRGLQQPYGGGGRHGGHTRLKTPPGCNHSPAYALDSWSGTDRFHFNAIVTPQDLEDTFNVPFRSCVVDGRAASVMCSYNQVNGVPTCADESFLRGTIRGKWHLEGYIVSDCDSVDVFYRDQHYTRTHEDAVAATLRAGLDLDCGPFLAVYTEGAVSQRKVTDADIDAAVTNTVIVQMRLGMYDGDLATQPFGHLGPQHVCPPAHQELALEAAKWSVVLLKNDGTALPLSRAAHHTVAKVEAEGLDRTSLLLPGRQAELVSAVAKASKGPVILVLMSGGPVDIAFAQKDRKIAGILWAGYPGQAGGQAIADVIFGHHNPDDKIYQKWKQGNEFDRFWIGIGAGGKLPVTWYPQDYLQKAVIFGHHNPDDKIYQKLKQGNEFDRFWIGIGAGGKLPVTWYPQDYLQKAPMTNMAMRADPARGYPGRTYRFYTGPTIHPFGHGLSYTKFTHTLAHAPAQLTVQLAGHHAAAAASSLNTTKHLGDAAADVRVSHARCQGLSIPVHVDVKIVGDRDGAHTVLVHASPPAAAAAAHGAPARQLVAFEKVHVPAGGGARVEMGLDVCNELSVAGRDGVRRIPVGEHTLTIGELTHLLTLGVEQLAV
uniref:Putative beta-D-xylosidase 2 n=1 Tax=Aegilops tauschii TaxID=37682 RepID=M8D5C8_AEGTA